MKGRCSCRQAVLKCSSHCHPKNYSCMNKDSSEQKCFSTLSKGNDEECTTTMVDCAKTTTSLLKRRKKQMDVKTKYRKILPDIPLKDIEIEVISEGGWLHNTHIQAASAMLKKQFALTVGFQSPVLGQTLSFDICKESVIQILNIQGNHWCTIAGTSDSVVNIYDSLLTYLPEDAKMQIAGIMCSQKATIECKLHKVQNQQGTSDCGLFAIAFATDLAYGNEPASAKYDQAKLREHFLDCLSKNILTPFPKTPSRYKKPRMETIKIFCKCRFPDNGKERMIQCDTCSEWYHQSCENVDSNLFTSQKTVWNSCENIDSNLFTSQKTV